MRLKPILFRSSAHHSLYPLLRRRSIPCGVRGYPLWSHLQAVVLDGKHMTIESRDPLFAFHRHLQIAQGVADIAFDFAPKKLRIALQQISRVLIAELFVTAIFGELSIQRVYLA